MQQQIIFTVEQINQLLNALGELPFKQAKGFIDFITQIAQPQIANMQQPEQPETEETPAE